jgi:hypothetical protein
MRCYKAHLASVTLMAGVLYVAPLAYAQTQKGMAEHDHSTHQHTDICAGFVVLPSGHAVLSAMEPDSTTGPAHSKHHGAGHDQASQQRGMADKSHMQHNGDMKHADPLMGHQHGDDIPMGEDVLCVPIAEMASTSWTSKSASANLRVTATSATGALAHNSRANESLLFNIMRDGKPVEQANVRVMVRMPHHDHRMPGGHGPANDPDVQGLEAQSQGGGHYALSTIDFSMGGAWLFEIDIQEGDTVYKAYFASEIGEE